eukprot:TRINITY_DN29383_c0_g1_i1.p1 TRINITY_DN29383_c0_g1~~TRINITY_DN29383_c0_g1_i1.p1  ORF type:complete len:434 (-),score=70.28 TRINITY_DN29383_c0_g1_i1:127-1428(-)
MANAPAEVKRKPKFLPGVKSWVRRSKLAGGTVQRRLSPAELKQLQQAYGNARRVRGYKKLLQQTEQRSAQSGGKWRGGRVLRADVPLSPIAEEDPEGEDEEVDEEAFSVIDSKRPSNRRPTVLSSSVPISSSLRSAKRNRGREQLHVLDSRAFDVKRAAEEEEVNEENAFHVGGGSSLNPPHEVSRRNKRGARLTHGNGLEDVVMNPAMSNGHDHPKLHPLSVSETSRKKHPSRSPSSLLSSEGNLRERREISPSQGLIGNSERLSRKGEIHAKGSTPRPLRHTLSLSAVPPFFDPSQRPSRSASLPKRTSGFGEGAGAFREIKPLGLGVGEDGSGKTQVRKEYGENAWRQGKGKKQAPVMERLRREGEATREAETAAREARIAEAKTRLRHREEAEKQRKMDKARMKKVTPKGQPIMRHRIEHLLEKIQKTA